MKISVLKIVLLGVLTITTCVCSLYGGNVKADYPTFVSSSEIKSRMKKHPRLLLGNSGFEEIKQASKSYWGQILIQRVCSNADLILDKPLLKHEVVGLRMLSTSREALFRFTTLSVAYAATDEKKYAQRCIAELINVSSAFKDWHPSHYLDVGEMALGVAIAYDWLYYELSPEQRKIVENAMLNYGMRTFFNKKYCSWLRFRNNWQQVNQAGLTACAIAMGDLEPNMAAKIINCGIALVKETMKCSYSPNGAYPEGPMYWEYGTEFNCVLISLLQNTFGKDFGLSAVPGFSQTGVFMQSAYGNTKLMFDYSDSGSRATINMDYADLWLINKFKRTDWATVEKLKILKDHLTRKDRRHESRLMPLAMLCVGSLPEKGCEPKEKFFFSKKDGQTATEIAMLRTGFNPYDAYLGVKGGSPIMPHGHIDAGSFVYEILGVRWIVDLGMVSSYEAIEGRGIGLWNNNQNGDRWRIFRLGEKSHSISLIDGKRPNVKGTGNITKANDHQVEMDLTTFYAGMVKRASRQWFLEDSGNLKLVTKFVGARPEADIVQQFCVAGKIEQQGEKIVLNKKGKKLFIADKHNNNWTWIECDKLHVEYDSPDKNRSMLYLRGKADAKGNFESTIYFSTK